MNKYFCDICNKEIGHKRHVRFLEIKNGDGKNEYELCWQCMQQIYSYIANKQYEYQKDITNDR